jgi:hypothetical protein
MTQQTKKCSCCKEIKSLSEYNKRSDCKNKTAVRYRSHCKNCTALKAAVKWETDEEFRNQSKNNAYKHNIKKKYGVTEEQYLKIYDKQNGLCAICGQKSQTKAGRLALDHCHKTGKIRGLLCVKCNAGIGMLQDDVNVLKSAILYLKNYSNV